MTCTSSHLALRTVRLGKKMKKALLKTNNCKEQVHLVESQNRLHVGFHSAKFVNKVLINSEGVEYVCILNSLFVINGKPIQYKSIKRGL